MGDETYGSDGFRTNFLHDERGKLIKGEHLFLNIYTFWVCIHASGFMKVIGGTTQRLQNWRKF